MLRRLEVGRVFLECGHLDPIIDIIIILKITIIIIFEGGHLDPINDIIIIIKIMIIIIFKGGHRVQGERRTWTGHFVSSSCCHQDDDG